MRLVRRTVFGPVAILVTVLSLGCRMDSRVELTSYSDPYFPERYHFSPSQCVYRHDAGGDCHVAAYSAGDEPGSTAGTQQWLHVHIYWKPRPGKTRDNPTSMDAVVRYVIKTDKGSTLYTGTAFAYAAEAKPGNGLKVSLESGRLRPAKQSGDGAEMLGETRLGGKLLASLDANAALDLMRQIDQAAGE